MKISLFVSVIAFVLLGGGCFSTDTQEQDPVVLDRHSILFEAKENGLIMSDTEVARMEVTSVSTGEGQVDNDVADYLNQDFAGWKSAALADVTGGGSFGLAYTQFENGQFTLVAKLGGLPDTADGYFYEGWLVKRGEAMEVISTGVVVKGDPWYGNVHLSSTDLSEFDFYVLTLEPDDGNPAPAEHILEGILK